MTTLVNELQEKNSDNKVNEGGKNKIKENKITESDDFPSCLHQSIA